MTIVVIIPTYNEKENIKKLLTVLAEEVFPKVKNHEIKVLVADDKSPDGTSDVVKDVMKKWKNIHLLEGTKEGLGAAYVRAMRYAMEKMDADAVLEFDADFQHDPHDIPRLIQAMDEGYDYVIGSRYVPGGKIPSEWGIHRKIMSRFGSLFARVVLMQFHIHDMTSGYKLTKSSYLKKVDLGHLYSKYYAYKIHILYEVARLGAKIKEVPIIFYERKEGSSKISRKDLLDSFWVVIRLRIRDSLRFIKFLLVGGTGFIVQLATQEFAVMLGAFHELGVGIGAESAIISNFLWNHFWTFNDTKGLKQNSHFIIKLIKFNLTSVFAIIVQVVAVWLAERILGETLNLFIVQIPTRIAILIPTIIFIVIPLNYLIYNKLIWKTQYLNDEKSSK